MPLQNRVLPTGEITAIPARGTLTGNRGIIHRGDKTLGTSRWSHHAWICCTLNWQGRKREVMTGRNWTELFFLDEAVALAAGHRPCGYCRRTAYAAYRDAWAVATGTTPKAGDIDAALHPARVTRHRQKVTYQAPLSQLPDGAFVQWADTPHLVQASRLLPYTPGGYGSPIVAQMDTVVSVLTPKPSVAVLSAGYTPQVHPSAAAAKT
ncbi:hypothetical protein [Yoonia sp. 208BN28-4]|uniref:hypothetical protein n=1 Tax=Yoonia sp. 208BN28-4 TaxID=3126505 RepID=UPI0030A76729